MEDHLVIGLAVAGSLIGLILLAVTIYLICRCCGKRHDGDRGSVRNFFRSREEVDPLMSIPCEPGYKPEDFHYAGELKLKEFEFNDKTLSALPPKDENPPDAHIQYTTGEGNVVFEVADGSKKLDR
ncbi:unnamed protein product [Bursaphelenchus xylophilus]|uniref:(pine wood nematode) hypothetical protein n=1 Tax=Bursaphelenchus xylophilus TaxID=6326 RepID=A0A1I7RK89_BURXY|nr:unnamed protein product [Bursaphelenchus xylophilus]CAG9131417.1 unnamed protein product [Bursaphelenchus xylophilus]